MGDGLKRAFAAARATRTKLTAAQLRVLSALADGALHRGSKETVDGEVHTQTTKRLMEWGLVSDHAIMIDGREIHGTDLGRHFGYWSTRYQITDAGRAALAKAGK